MATPPPGRAVCAARLPRTLLALAALLLLANPAAALTELADQELTGVNGAGMVFVWTDFRFLMNPTSYVEQVGSNVIAPGLTSRRGDLRWYGLAISAEAPATLSPNFNTTWTNGSGVMTACTTPGIDGLGCPRGGPIANFAAFDNPYILRAFSYAGDGTAATAIGNGIVTYQGVNTATAWSASNAAAGSAQTVLEWLAPTNQQDFRFSFWGEIESARNLANGSTGKGLLKTQSIIQGKPSGSVLQFYKFTQTTLSPGVGTDPSQGVADPIGTVNTAGTAYSNQSLALLYHSRLTGDFRFSVAQNGTYNNVQGTPVQFDAGEGMYFRNVDAFLPLGQLFYQALVLDVPRCLGNNNPAGVGCTTANAPITTGNFTLEIPMLPNRTAVFTRFYNLVGGTLPTGVQASEWGYITARNALFNTGTQPDVNYDKTHGYSRWGDWHPCNAARVTGPTGCAPASGTRNSQADTSDGIFFQKCAACSNFSAYAASQTRLDVRGPGFAYNETTYYSNHATSTPNPTGVTNPGTINAVYNTGVANLGDAAIEGIAFNHLKFTSYGAQY